MKRGFLLFVSLAVMAIQSLFAQNFSVKGTVFDGESNEPLIGVTIMQEGTNNGVITDIDGSYSIEIKGVAKATVFIHRYAIATARSDATDSQTGHHDEIGCTDGR